MENGCEFNAFKASKPLYAAAVYGAVIAVVFLIIPFLPLYEIYGYLGTYNFFSASFGIIDSVLNPSSGMTDDKVFYLIGCAITVVSLLCFTVYFAVKLISVLLKIKTLKQFAVIETDLIYAKSISFLLSAFLFTFIFALLYRTLFNKVATFYIPTVYLIVYGVLPIFGLIFNAVCKNLCGFMRDSKKNALYYGTIFAIFFILSLVATFSSIMACSSNSIAVFSATDYDAVFIQDSDSVSVSVKALSLIMNFSDAGLAFQFLATLIATVAVSFVIGKTLSIVKKYSCSDSATIVRAVIEKGEAVGAEAFSARKKTYEANKNSGVALIVLGVITLFAHLSLYPIMSAIENAGRNVFFSIAPVLGVLMVMFGVGIVVGVHYFNAYFIKQHTEENQNTEENQAENAVSATEDENAPNISESADTSDYSGSENAVEISGSPVPSEAESAVESGVLSENTEQNVNTEIDESDGLSDAEDDESDTDYDVLFGSF